ncbi:MAG: carbohydrate-binding domain-containing protein [Clostridia bacterium]|nr:carbohydrate-binding domain-containing protein [Clostridia bacterium]
MKMKILTAFAIISVLTATSLTGCIGAADTEKVTAAENIDIEFTERDKNTSYDDASATKIALSSDTATISGDGANADNNIVTISEEGTYIISGELNGQIIIEAADTEKIQLILNNAVIHNENGAAIYIKEADKVFITLNENTVNTLSNGEGAEDTGVDGVIYSKADLTVNGKGELNVNGNYKHGIVSKDDLVITGGNITVNSENIGLYGKDCVKIADGSIVLNTGTDGIQSDNTDENKGYIYISGGSFNINAGNDALQAETILRLDNGEFNIKTGNGSESESAKKNSTHENMGRDGMKGGRMNSTPPDMDNEDFKNNTPPDMDNEDFKNNTPPDMNGGDFKNNIPPDMNNKSDNNIQNQTAPAEETTEETTTESKKALKSGSELIINNGSFNINSEDDALHTNGNITIEGGTLSISSGDDGIHADEQVLINNGTINITDSYEGIEGNIININGGNIVLNASDDGINASSNNDNIPSEQRKSTQENETEDTYIRITNGNINVTAKGDGIDSNGSIYIDGGSVFVNGPESNGDGALDYEKEAVITGGTVIATGSSGMAQGFSDSSAQYSILHNFENSLNASDIIKLTDSDGNVILEYTPAKKYQSVVISCPELSKDKSYTLSAGSLSETLTLSSVVTSNGGFGNNRGGEMNRNFKPEINNSQNNVNS